MKHIKFFDIDGKDIYSMDVKSFLRGHGRAFILKFFSEHPETEYFETNVRRYTAEDIYAGRLGQAI